MMMIKGVALLAAGHEFFHVRYLRLAYNQNEKPADIAIILSAQYESAKPYDGK